MLSHIDFTLAIVGEKAAGKDAVAELICDASGAWTMRYSDPIRVAHLLCEWSIPLQSPEQLGACTAQVFTECGWTTRGAKTFDAAFYAERETVPPTTFALQDLGNSLKRQFGPEVLTRVVLQVADVLHKDIVVVNGIRNPAEFGSFEERLAGKHALGGVRADLNLRKKRFLEGRRRIGDPVTEEDFLRLDRRDQGEGEPPDGQQVAKCLELIDSGNMVRNNGTLDQLRTWVRAWYGTLAHRHGLPMRK